MEEDRQVAGPLPAELPGGCLLSPDFLGEKETETLLVQPAKTFSISSRPLAILSDTQHGVLRQNYTKDNCGGGDHRSSPGLDFKDWLYF